VGLCGTVSKFGTITTWFASFALKILRQQRVITSPSNDDPAFEKLRADFYYPIIDRAIKQLPSNECEARRTLYDRARVALTNKLDGEHTSQIRREQRALELAIRRAEAFAATREIINQKLGDLRG
jgi:hypothetical protein